MSELSEVLKDRFTIVTEDNGKVVRYLCGCYGVQVVEPEPPLWAFPVGSPDYPPEIWYCASLHSLDGSLNNGYKHSGIDINLDVHPWGDVERTLGLTVKAVTEGDVVYVSQDWYGAPMVVVLSEHAGSLIWIRYAHIVPSVRRGDRVKAGQVLGPFANWRTGDHLHLDMALDEISDDWLTPSVRWVDPVSVLKLYLDAGIVDEMVKKDVKA